MGKLGKLGKLAIFFLKNKCKLVLSKTHSWQTGQTGVIKNIFMANWANWITKTIYMANWANWSTKNIFMANWAN